MATVGHLIAAAVVMFALPVIAAQGWRAKDGDSIVAPWGEEIRVVEVDSPEMDCRCPSECSLARKAKEFTQSTLNAAKNVRLLPYRQDKDRYGRSLRFVEVDGQRLDRMLIDRGLGRFYDGRSPRKGWCEAK